MDERTHTAIKVYTCWSCNTVKTLNPCNTGTVERFGLYIVKQSVSVRTVTEFIVGGGRTNCGGGCRIV